MKSVDNEIEKIFLYKVKQSRIDKKSSYIHISIYYVVHFIHFLHSAVIFIARFIERDGKSANLHVTLVPIIKLCQFVTLLVKKVLASSMLMFHATNLKMLMKYNFSLVVG